MEEKFLKEKKHQEFIEKEKFGANIFPDKSRLLKIIIAPLSLYSIQVNYQELKDWLQKNCYPRRNAYWIPFLDGVRNVVIVNNEKKEEIPVAIALLFHNATISFCSKLDCPEEDKPDISIGWITEEIKEFLDFANSFYREIKFPDSEPVKIHLRLENVKGLPANLNINTFRRLDWDFLSKAFVKRWLDNNLIFDENSSGKEIIENSKEVAKQISNRLVRTFGIWETPYFKEK